MQDAAIGRRGLSGDGSRCVGQAAGVRAPNPHLGSLYEASAIMLGAHLRVGGQHPARGRKRAGGAAAAGARRAGGATDAGAGRRDVAQESENGGYSSCSSSRYASTRVVHRSAPTEKPYSPAGWRPVKSTASHATSVTTAHAIDNAQSTSSWGIARMILKATEALSRGFAGSSTESSTG